MRTPTLYDESVSGKDYTTNRDNENFIVEKIISGYFSIDEYGNVFNNKTKKFVGSSSTGYKRITCNNEFGKPITANVNRLVYLFYVGDIPANFVVNHSDGDKLNNFYQNLEAMSESDNHKHAYRTGLKHVSDEKREMSSTLARGEKNVNAKLTSEEVLLIRRQVKTKQSCLSLISEQYGITERTARQILTGKTYSSVPEHVTPLEIKEAMLYFRRM